MDDADRAAPEMERATLEAQRMKKPVGPVANGRCHYCGEILDDESRWCDSGCRDAWEHLLKHLR